MTSVKLHKALSKSAKQQPHEEESIYQLAVVQEDFAAPKVRNHNSGSSVATGNLPPKPRTHGDSSQIENILNPVKGLRDAQARSGMKPTDHGRNNKAAIKEASQLNGLRKLSDHGNDNNQGLKRTVSASTKNQQSFGAAARSTSAPLRRLSRDSSGRDFLAENRQQAASSIVAGAAPRPPKQVAKGDDPQKFLAKKDYGKVPKYLEQRKVAMAEHEEEERAAKEAAKIPPGMRIMPEEERLEMLTLLQKNFEEVEKAIQRLPFVIETPSQIRRKNELEMRLKEIMDAQKIFSRANVMVRVTDD